MKRIIALLIASALFQWVAAQVKEGKITYEEKIDMYRRIPKENEQMRAMMPQFRTTKYELLFADNKSVYQKQEEETDLSEQPQGGMIIRFGGADNIYFKDFNSNKSIEKRDLMEKEFIVEDTIHNIGWKLVDGETKTILGHVCKKATGKSERGMDLIAWYTEDIILSAGPAQFSGLPGLILGLDISNAEITYTAQEIKNEVKKADIKAPAKGKKVTPDEFVKIRMELMGDGNGPVRIVTN
ncbi:MAG: GLPGLI family protein [Sphingobacteriales bacterium]|nr:GLPGLI family protein [Sphingobacteriales bacterium]MBI3720058.1 GLPGLI family protein [Sphingobacteriales bacterium]